MSKMPIILTLSELVTEESVKHCVTNVQEVKDLGTSFLHSRSLELSRMRISKRDWKEARVEEDSLI